MDTEPSQSMIEPGRLALTTGTDVNGWKRWVPGLQTIRHYKASWLTKDIAADINQSTAGKPAGDGKGRITLSFSNYVVNKGVNNDLFK